MGWTRGPSAGCATVESREGTEAGEGLGALAQGGACSVPSAGRHTEAFCFGKLPVSHIRTPGPGSSFLLMQILL